MGANIGWSYGTDGEYRQIANTLNTASPQALRTFVYGLRAGVDYAEAHRLAFPSLMPAVYDQVHRRWFTDEPFWFGDSVLNPGQIHEVMCESRARLAELLLAGARSVQIRISCAYAQMSATITWPGATRTDAELTDDAELWAPADVAGQDVALWLRTPFNSGYHGARDAGRGLVPIWTEPLHSGDPAQEAAHELDLLVADVTKALLDRGYTFEQCLTDPAAEQARRSILADVRHNQAKRLIDITMFTPANRRIFSGTILGCYGGADRPGRADLVTTFEQRIQTPPALAAGIVEAVGDYRINTLDIPWWAGPGVTITCGQPVVEEIPDRW